LGPGCFTPHSVAKEQPVPRRNHRRCIKGIRAIVAKSPRTWTAGADQRFRDAHQTPRRNHLHFRISAH